MALASAAAAVALMAIAASQLSSAAMAMRMPPIGQPGCDTTCGNVSVPYPFGLGPSRCYWPGLNLTCDTSSEPRLLLGDGLRVAEISLPDRSVRVMRTGYIINTTGDFTTSTGWNASLDFGRGFRDKGFLLSDRNELVVSGCNVTATLSADHVFGGDDEETTTIIAGCSSFCTRSNWEETGKFCTGTSGCCQAPLADSGVPVPNGVEARWLYTATNHTDDQTTLPVTVFVAEQGWVDKGLWPVDDDGRLWEVPLLLDFVVNQGLPQGQPQCGQHVERRICKSEHSECLTTYPGYACLCKDGYDGNPYLAGGCQDVDECKLVGEDTVCFGLCTNTIGSYECHCPPNTYGNPNIDGGCFNYNFNTDVALDRVPSTGMLNCSTRCGDVSVPYPFGFGRPGCSWPGLNLTCDTRHSPPRLLLGLQLQVVDISLRNSTLRVVHHSRNTANVTIQGDSSNNNTMDADIRLPADIREPYALSTGNELLVFSSGWDLRATLCGEYTNGTAAADDSAISRAAVCSSGQAGDGDGYCQAPISAGTRPKRVKFEALNNKNISLHQFSNWSFNFSVAFISEVGLIDQWYNIVEDMSDESRSSNIASPIVLQWAVKQGLSSVGNDSAAGNNCPGDVSKQLCRSEHSYCRRENGGGYTCHCSDGYFGNPYTTHGCQDLCNVTAVSVGIPCFGYCNLKPAGQQPPIDCQCPRGTDGDPYKLGGCAKSTIATGLTIGFSVATSGPALLLVALGIILLRRKIKRNRIKELKLKYFNQNRGQLLQQLVSQKADIAERMIIPVDELAKATNNFDKAREVGGGGHGTVYKGILSDLHVVAIKKPKITLQKEIDEFINEVAILSQVNHKNVVKLFGCCLETEVPLLVYEFIPNGTLYDHLHIEEPKSSLSWSDRLRIATEIATSLAYLHSSVSIPIIHRDIKSSNILLDDTMTSKISDFGASRYIPIDNTDKTTRIQGTFGYLDPECFYTGRLTDKSDVYSFGVILVELLTRKKPTCSHLSNEGGGLVPHFVNLLTSGNLVQIMDPQVLEEGGKEVQEVAMLAASCIKLRGEERPTMRQVELTLEGLQQGSNKNYKKDDMVTEEFENGSIGENYSSGTSEGRRFEECSRRYSLEQDMMISASAASFM